MAREYDRKLILEDGSEYYGYGFGADEERVCEVVFNTSMVGYQEIVSDPSYTYQAVVFTYPLIGNYGINADDDETKKPTIGAIVVGEYNPHPSNFRSRETLSDKLKKFGIPAIEGVDTRRLTRSIRDFGSRRGILTDVNVPAEEGVKKILATPVPHDAVPLVTSKKAWFSPAEKPFYHVVAVDCGIKLNIVRSLNRCGCDVTVVPCTVTAEEVLKRNPDGLFLSNGPGDPEDVTNVISLVKELRGKLPIFGICLGHQMIALAYGAKTYKLKFGHRGGNHPVKNLLTGKVEGTYRQSLCLYPSRLHPFRSRRGRVGRRLYRRYRGDPERDRQGLRSRRRHGARPGGRRKVWQALRRYHGVDERQRGT